METLRSSYIALFLAPLSMWVSTFFWAHGEYGVIGGTVLVFSTIFWIVCFGLFFGLLRHELPMYSLLGFVIDVYGCVGGANFGLVGVFEEAFGIPHAGYLQ